MNDPSQSPTKTKRAIVGFDGGASCSSSAAAAAGRLLRRPSIEEEPIGRSVVGSCAVSSVRPPKALHGRSFFVDGATLSGKFNFEVLFAAFIIMVPRLS